MAGPYQKKPGAPRLKLRRGSLLFAAGVAACSGRSRDAGPASSGPRTADEPGPATPAGRPLDAARLDALAAVAVPGHAVTVLRRGARELAAQVVAEDGARATVTISACLACVPIDLAAWRARARELAALWAPRPTDTLTIEPLTAAGVTAIAVRARRPDQAGALALDQLHWNDGATQLAVVCEGRGARPACAPAAEAALAAYLPVLSSGPRSPR